MALINSLQHTTLKDFPKYTGRQPFIRKDIKNPPVYNTVSKAIESRGDDVVRLTKFIASGPGIKFLGNVAGLTAIDRGRTAKPLQRDRKEDGGKISFVQGLLGFLGALGVGLLDATAKTAAVSLSTISQAGLAGTGTHLVLGFRGKRGYLPGVQGHVISSQGGTVNIPKEFNKFGGASELENGDSKTYQQTGLNFPNKFKADKFSYDTEFNGSAQLKNKDTNPIDNTQPYSVGGNDRKLFDFTKTGDKLKEIDSKIIKEKRLGLPQTGGRGKIRYTSNYMEKPNLEAQDSIGMMGPASELDTEGVTDLIKFNFEVIDPDPGEENVFLNFRAYLDSFSDSFSGNWGDNSYFGRAEKFYTYGGFDRSLSWSFKVVADTRDALKPMYKKLNYLASTTAPSYDTDQSFMRGTFINVTIGDYLVSQPGFFTAVNLAWDVNYPWEINLTGKEKVQQLPHILNCDVEFTPVHRFAPQTGLYHYFTNPTNKKYFVSGEDPLNTLLQESKQEEQNTNTQDNSAA